ncbi:MAG: M56 family metallopeptidase [Bacteroidota bacterium]
MFDMLSDAAWAQTLVAWLATYALHSTLLLGAAWLASRWISSALALDALWKTGVLAAIVTTSVQMGLQPAAYVASSPTESTLVLLRGEAAGQLIELSADKIIVRESDEAAPLVIERVPQPELLREPVAAVPGWTPIPLRKNWRLPEGASLWVAVLAGFWLLGVVVEGLRRARAHRQFIARIAGRKSVGSSVLVAELNELAQRVGLRYPLQLTQTPTVAVPVALGVNEVVLPAWVVEEATPSQQRAMMAHEVAHLARRDPFWLAVFAVMESVFFFQPLNRLARRRQQAAAERLCDAWAAAQASPLVMARCLVDAASRLRAHRSGGASSALPHLVPGMATGSTLGDRVERLVSTDVNAESQRRWPVLIAAAMLIALVAVAAPTVMSAAQVPPVPSPAPPAPPPAPAIPTVRALPIPSPAPPPTPPPAPIVLEGFVADTSTSFTYTRDDDNARIRVEQEGSVTLASNGALTALSPGGRLLIDEELLTLRRRYEARTDDAGGIVEVYEVNGSNQALGADARRWVRDRYDEASSVTPPPPPHLPASLSSPDSTTRARLEQEMKALEEKGAVYMMEMRRYAERLARATGVLEAEFERQEALLAEAARTHASTRDVRLDAVRRELAAADAAFRALNRDLRTLPYATSHDAAEYSAEVRSQVEALARRLQRIAPKASIPALESEALALPEATRDMGDALQRDLEQLLERSRHLFRVDPALVDRARSFRSNPHGVYRLGSAVVEGSVRVTAGGVQLVESEDYTVDYATGEIRLSDRTALTSEQEIMIDFERLPAD